MAGRIRSIKPEILDDEECINLSDEAWRLWVSCFVLADDHGNLRASDRYLSANVWQDTGRSPRVAEILRELRQANRVEIYESKGERYLHLRNWEKHQRVDNAGKGRVPAPDHEDSHTWDDFRGEPPRESATVGDSPLRAYARPRAPRPRPRSTTTNTVAFDLESVYARYPRKEGKQRGMKIATREIKTADDFAALGRAVDEYTRRVAGRDREYIKQFDTFMGCWRDFLEPVAPADPRGPLERAMDERHLERERRLAGGTP